MQQKILCLIIGWIILLPNLTLADGKFYTSEEIPPDLPYQRAIIAYQDGQELLILQSKFEGKGEDFGWVVPVPTNPKLASIPAGIAKHLFFLLGIGTRPRATFLSMNRPFLLTLGIIAVLLALLIYDIRRRALPGYLKTILSIILGIPTVLLLLLLASALLLPGLAGVKPTKVVILKEEKVGVYDTKVIKATDSKELIDWLNQHGYKFTPQDETAFKSYIDKGWCFVTARINAEELKKDEFRSVEGLVNPLVFLFESNEIVYPLALTGTIGKETKILLYVFAEHKTTAGIPFKMAFAGEHSFEEFKEYIQKIDPSDFFDGIDIKPGYLTKFRGTLTPEQMQHDLIFSPAPDDKPYRETVVRW